MNTTRTLSDEDVFHALRLRIAEKFAADLSVILQRVYTDFAGRPLERVLDEISDRVRALGVEPDREALRPHAILIASAGPIADSPADMPEPRTPPE